MSATQMRHLINMVSLEDDFIAFCTSESRILNEGLLIETPLADRIKATAAKLNQRYNGVKYELLARATNKVMDLFSTKGVSPEVQNTLKRIAKVGKFAMKNRALVSILLGMVGALVGLAHNPTAMAQAATKMDDTLSGTIDEIIDKLTASGIDLGHETGDQGMISDIISNLPPDVGHNFEKVAKALRAIENYEFRGVNVSTESSMSDMHVDGEVTKIDDHTFDQHIMLKTLDGKLTLSELTTHMENGKITDSQSGVGRDLHQIMTKLATLPEDKQEELANYISNGNPGSVQFAQPNGFITALMNHKAAFIGAAIGAAIGARPNGRYSVKLGPDGAKVTALGSNGAPAPQKGPANAAQKGPANGAHEVLQRKQIVNLALKAHGGTEKSRKAVAAKVQQIPADQLPKYLDHYQSEISKLG